MKHGWLALIRVSSVFHPWLLFFACWLPTLNDTAAAQETGAPQWMPEPAFVVTAAGVDRLLEDAHHLFTAAGRPELSAAAEGWMTKLNQLQGFDRTRPLGLMLFVESVPSGGDPAPLIFATLTNLDDLRTTVARTGNRLEAADAPDTYRLHLGGDELVLALREGLVLIARPQESDELLSNPAVVKLAREPIGEEDLFARLRFSGFPDSLITQVLKEAEQNSDRDRGRRPEEKEGEHAIRLEAMDRTLGIVTLMLRGTDEIQFRARLKGDNAGGEFSANLLARPGSPFAGWLSKVLTEDAAPFASDQIPLGLSVSLRLTESATDFALRILKQIEGDAERDLESTPAEFREAIDGLFRSARATLETGRLSASLQFRAVESERFVLLANAPVEGASAIDRALRVLLRYAQADETIRQLEFDHATANDVSIHRFQGRTLRPRDVRVYGEQARVHLAAGSGFLWLAFGESPATELLKNDIRDLLIADSSPPAEATEASTGDSFLKGPATARWHLRMRPWLSLLRNDRAAEIPLRGLMDAAFPSADARDRLQAVLAPAENGASLRVRVEEGYIRLLCRAVAARMKSR